MAEFVHSSSVQGAGRTSSIYRERTGADWTDWRRVRLIGSLGQVLACLPFIIKFSCCGSLYGSFMPLPSCCDVSAAI